MNVLGNILWFIFGGFLSGISWFILGGIWCITIVGIPIGLQCFKFASLAFMPFGKEVQYTSDEAKAILEQFKIGMEKSYQFELDGDYIQERYNYSPYVGVKMADTYSIYSFEEKGSSYVNYVICIVEDTNLIKVSFSGVIDDKLYEEYMEYVKNMSLPDPSEVELIKGGYGK